MRQCANKVSSHEQAGDIGTLARLFLEQHTKNLLSEVRKMSVPFPHLYTSL